MSSQLKAAMRSFARSGKQPQIPVLVHPKNSQNDAPFERYQHFVVAPGAPQPTTSAKRRLGPLEDPSSSSAASQENLIKPTTPLEQPASGISQQQLFKFDHKIEKFMVHAAETTVWEATEKLFTSMFSAQGAVYFVDIPSLGVLYSPTQEIYTRNDTGIVSIPYKTRSIYGSNSPLDDPAYDQDFDSNFIVSNCPTVAFPIFDFRNKIVGVMLIYRTYPDSDFGTFEEQFISFFQHKFQVFSRWLLNPPVQEPMVLDILQLHRIEQLVPALTGRLMNFFNCRICEVWSYDKAKKKIIRYTDNEMIEIPKEDAGIIGEALETETTLNVLSNVSHPAYNSIVDNTDEEALIGIPVPEATNRFVIATVLRGPQSRPLFNADDDDSLRKLAPFVTLAIANATAFSKIQTEFERSMEEREGLAALLEVAEILSGQLDTERLCEIIMEKGRYLTKADRCSLFLVSQDRNHLITSFHRGLKNCIDIPISKGVVGRTVTEAKALNISDAYEDPNFDNTTDIQTGYRTKSILSVPIFNQRGEVMGVTEMINKSNGEAFNKWDTNMIQIFNVFCGISLENARLYKESLDMSSQLRSFFGISITMAKAEDTKRVMSDIVRNARRALDARRATVFLYDESTSSFASFIVDGGKMPPTLPANAGIVGACFRTREGIICNDAYNDPRFNRNVDNETGFKTISLLAVPIIAQNGNTLGVVEMVNKIHGAFREKDQKLLQSIATFASVTLENSRLKDIAALGSVEVELPKCLADNERITSVLPQKLALTNEEIDTVGSLRFLATDWDGIGLIKVIFHIFYQFELLSTYNISNETFFKFIYEVRSSYNDVPYHNWIHACDVTQYVSYELKTAKADQIFTKLELFSLLASSVCHDANHDGFNNIYNLKAETPLGILFKDQSVMETHHCTIAINILSREECNIFKCLSMQDSKFMWNQMIKLILATDMAHHFNLVKMATEALDKKEFSFQNQEHRLLAMQLILKTADISNVSRPFNVAEKWCDILCEEFFRQGDNEKKQGIELTSPLNDREHSDKPKSQIGFYNFICLPLYNVVARIFTELEVNANSVKSNLEKWKELANPPNTK